MAIRMLGKEVNESLNAKLRSRVQALGAHGITPKLAIVRCGEKPADLVYESNARKRAESVGVAVETRALPENADKTALLESIRELNADESVHGVLLLRPLPAHLKPFSGEICNALDPKKDVDCMTDLSFSGVLQGRSDLGFAPCTAQACMEMLDFYGVGLRGKRAAVIGRSLVIGKPIALMLLQKDATVTVCHTKTENLAEIVQSANIVICAAGAMGLVTKDFVRPGQTVVDVSMNWNENKPNAKGGRGAFTGDCVFDEVEPIVEMITPVPGGVGAVTTSVLIAHVVEAAARADK